MEKTVSHFQEAGLPSNKLQQEEHGVNDNEDDEPNDASRAQSKGIALGGGADVGKIPTGDVSEAGGRSHLTLHSDRKEAKSTASNDIQSTKDKSKKKAASTVIRKPPPSSTVWRNAASTKHDSKELELGMTSSDILERNDKDNEIGQSNEQSFSAVASKPSSTTTRRTREGDEMTKFGYRISRNVATSGRKSSPTRSSSTGRRRATTQEGSVTHTATRDGSDMTKFGYSLSRNVPASGRNSSPMRRHATTQEDDVTPTTRRDGSDMTKFGYGLSRNVPASGQNSSPVRRHVTTHEDGVTRTTTRDGGDMTKFGYGLSRNIPASGRNSSPVRRHGATHEDDAAPATTQDSSDVITSKPGAFPIGETSGNISEASCDWDVSKTENEPSSLFQVEACLVDVEAEESQRRELEELRRNQVAHEVTAIAGIIDPSTGRNNQELINRVIAIVCICVVVFVVVVIVAVTGGFGGGDDNTGGFGGGDDIETCHNLLKPGYCFKDKDELVKAMKCGPQDDELPMGSWCVEKITDFSYLIEEAGKNEFNENISSWNVSSATSMKGMFKSASSFDQDLSKWDVSKVTDMQELFQGAEEFNGDVRIWNVSSVTNMFSLFDDCEKFDQDISKWNVGRVENMENMFSRAKHFNQNLSSWDVSKVTNMEGLFDGAKAFNQDISSWNVSLVRNMNQMFKNADQFNQTLCAWGDKITNQAVTVKDMFEKSEVCDSSSDPNLTAIPKGPFCKQCVTQ